MKAELICMVEKFPALSENIMDLYKTNEGFQTLCSDYLLCLNTLDQWVSSLKKDELLIREYSDLEKILHAELLQYIEKSLSKS